MLPNNLPVEANHSSLDLFEKPSLLVTFDTSFEQKVGPLYAPNGPTLEFERVGDRNNFIDLQNICLEVKCRILQANGNNLRYDTTDASLTDSPCFVNNTLHSLFSDCTVSANGFKISSSNGYHAQKAFLETEFSHNKEAKDTWLKCQGYSYEKSPATFTGATFTTRQGEKVAADVFSCDKHLLSGVTLRISFLRSRPNFSLIYDDDAKDYKIEISQANLYVRKMTVSENVYSEIESTLAKASAMYRYTEIIPKTFIVSKGLKSWNHEDIFNREPIRRFALAMTTNSSFLGAKRENPFHFRKFDLDSITVLRNGYPIAGTPLQTDNDKKQYLNSLEALAFRSHGHGIPIDDFPDHYVLVFDLTRTQQASHDYLYPELTNGSISIDLRFSKDIPDSLELFFLGERSSTIYINSARKIRKNFYLESESDTKK